MRNSRAAVYAASLLALVLAATASSAAQTVKTCQLFTQQDAAALYGSALQPPMDVGTMCMYVNPSVGAVVTITISPATAASGADFVRVKMGVGKGDTTESISGLGDQNLLDIRPNGTNVLTVFYHQKMIVLSVQKHMDTTLKAAMIRAARQIMAKI
jgi:hypothetical protein